jgi:hypothetical protein
MTIQSGLLSARALAATVPSTSTESTPWRRPRPHVALMWFLGVINRWLFLKGIPLLRRVPFLRDLPLVHGYFWVRGIELPEADRRALCGAVNEGTVAFLGPNHPEFGTDWMIDKEISTWVAPRMASWADRGIVSSAPGFWGMNNLIANDGGDAARDYSVEWALGGNAVLLHPEGTVRWTNDHVHPLFPGIAQMAIRAAQQTDKPVYIVPVVWKYRYARDVSHRIVRELRILERGLGLAPMNGLSVPVRFHALQTLVLERQMARFGYCEGACSGDFFERQGHFQQWLVDALEQRHATDLTEHSDRRIARLTRAIRTQLVALRGEPKAMIEERRAQLKADLRIAEEARRLGEFSRAVYGTPMLSQEQLFESLKRIRDRLVNHDWKARIANMLPRPFGPRMVHVGVPEPIRVERVGADHTREYEAGLLAIARSRMQAKLDEINERLATEGGRTEYVNPFIRPGGPA